MPGLLDPEAALTPKRYRDGIVDGGGIAYPVVNRYKRGLTAGHGSPRQWQPGPAADVQSTEAPAAAMDRPRLLLIPCCIGCPGWIEAPGRGGIGASSAWGSPRPNAPHFSGAYGVSGHHGCSGSSGRWVGVSYGFAPQRPWNSPPRRRGIPSPLRSVGIHTKGKGDVCLWGGEQRRRPGIRVGLGSTAAMGALERSSDQLPNGPVVGTVSGGSFVRTETDPERQPSPRLGCETRSGCKRAV